MTIIVRSSNHINQLGKVSWTARPLVNTKEDCIMLSLASLIEASKKIPKCRIIIAGSLYSERLKNFIKNNNLELIETPHGDTPSIVFCLEYIKNEFSNLENESIYLTEDDYYYSEAFLYFCENALNKNILGLENFKEIVVTPFAPFGRFYENDNFSLYSCSFVNFAMKSNLWRKLINKMIDSAKASSLESHMNTLWKKNEDSNDKNIALVSSSFYGAIHLQQPDFDNFKNKININQAIVSNAISAN